MMRGTWGTGARGQTTDEGALTFPVGGYEETAHELAEQGASRWLLLEDAPLIAHSESRPTVLGYGWLALTPIRAAGRRWGMMYSDAALSRAAFSPATAVQLAVLCSLFGAILQRHEEPRRDAASRAPSAEGIHPAVRLVLDLLDGDLTRTTEELALAAGTTPRHLARLFRTDIGESLVSYRNRRRLERFFATTDGSQENLLQAALSAGFGSNAQFHRVFRSLLGTTPGEYLTGRKLEEPDAGPK
jgi:AraC-like DNA-binding protein